MKKRLPLQRRILVFSTCVWISLGLSAVFSPCVGGTGDEYRPGAANFCLKVGYEMGELDSLITEYDMTVFDSIPAWRMYFSTFPDSIAVDAVVSALEDEECVLWAEPDFYVYSGLSDPLYEDQWHLEHQANPGDDWADIQANSSWAIETGSCEVRVAILDTGIPYDDDRDLLTHEDLNNSDTCECPIILRRSEPDQNMNDIDGHGTKIAGVLGARTNNSRGVAGVAYGSAMVIYNRSDVSSDVLVLMHDAMDSEGGNADIISISFKASDSDAWRLALDSAEAANVLLVACAGNIQNPSLDDPWYPCAYSDAYDNILCVGGTDIYDEFWHVEGPPQQGALNYPQINVSGPAHHIVTTNIGTSTSYTEFGENLAGTSFAAPIVAGVAALVLSQARESGIELTAQEIRDIITASSDDCNNEEHPGRDDSLGFGRVNAFKALLRTPGTKELETDLTIPPHHYNAHSPYVIVGTLVVPEGKNLVIEAGTEIQFAPGSQLVVQGTLAVEGTESEHVVFIADPEMPESGWAGI